MANEEHVEIMKAGNLAIATWQRENPYSRLDLTNADLQGAIRRAGLRGASGLTARNR